MKNWNKLFLVVVFCILDGKAIVAMEGDLTTPLLRQASSPISSDGSADGSVTPSPTLRDDEAKPSAPARLPRYTLLQELIHNRDIVGLTSVLQGPRAAELLCAQNEVGEVAMQEAIFSDNAIMVNLLLEAVKRCRVEAPVLYNVNPKTGNTPLTQRGQNSYGSLTY
jgi:hypothetical protein